MPVYYPEPEGFGRRLMSAYGILRYRADISHGTRYMKKKKCIVMPEGLYIFFSENAVHLCKLCVQNGNDY